jgi:soluble lytic murein transglycosylase-like protein
MRRSPLLWLFAVGGAYLAYRVLTQPSASGTLSEQVSNLGEDIVNTVSPGAWKSSAKAQQYVPYINDVETYLGIPPDLLARIAYEESHFRDDIVSGIVKSPVGAVGLMQLMPQYFPGAGVNWQTDVQTAGSDLVSLFKQFNDWQLAVAAYNWGPGNVRHWLSKGGYSGGALPTETSKYVTQILADVPLAGALVNV